MKLLLSERQAENLLQILMNPATRATVFAMDKPYERLMFTAVLWEVIDMLSLEVEWPIDEQG